MTASLNLSLRQAQQWLTQAHAVGDAATVVHRVHTDSRTLQPGDLFVALRGERFDAHDFLSQAKAQGIACALAERGLQEAGLSGLQVPDSRVALGELAAGWRRQFHLPLVAVTGSNGKTTVTQMIASILRAWAGDHALATQGNFNNDIGLPLTLLRLRAEHRCAVVEIGMNHPGEIEGLARMAAPTVALVNNAQREHQEFMASVEAVARENGAVLEALPQDGVAVFPADDAYTPLWQSLAGNRRCLRFGEAVAAEVSLLSSEWLQNHWQVSLQSPVGQVTTRLHLAGRHNVRNALAATACALAAGAPLAAIAQGLDNFAPVKGRSRAFQLAHQGRLITVVDDTYNANPDSVRAAIDVLAELPAPRMLVLGDMGEVGTQGPAFHAEVGQHARAQHIDRLLALGDLSLHAAQAYGQGTHFESMDHLQSAVLAQLPQMGSVLVKGSRFMKMERVIDALQANAMSKEDTPCC
jgi:UDP-N-acetylmuramoyl-tripeptide--D-alanyl-D-alanine ligase